MSKHIISRKLSSTVCINVSEDVFEYLLFANQSLRSESKFINCILLDVLFCLFSTKVLIFCQAILFPDLVNLFPARVFIFIDGDAHCTGHFLLPSFIEYSLFFELLLVNFWYCFLLYVIFLYKSLFNFFSCFSDLR